MEEEQEVLGGLGLVEATRTINGDLLDTAHHRLVAVLVDERKYHGRELVRHRDLGSGADVYRSVLGLELLYSCYGKYGLEGQTLYGVGGKSKLTSVTRVVVALREAKATVLVVSSTTANDVPVR